MSNVLILIIVEERIIIETLLENIEKGYILTIRKKKRERKSIIY